MKLVITEKPSVARDIASVFKINGVKKGYIEGRGCVITWAFGHLIGLAQMDEYDEKFKRWTFEDLPFIPDTFQKKILDSSKEQFETIKALCQRDDVEEIICATDAGREGELIFRLIYEESGCQVPIKRLWISSQTESAIKQGFDQLKPGDDYLPLYDSARCRSEADWLIGINATRAYSIKYSRGHGVMSVGRVQTPVLKMIVDRYRDHMNFDSKTFYECFSDMNFEDVDFQVKWFKDKEDRLFDKSVAETLLDSLQNHQTGVVESLKENEKIENQPLLYDLTELQKEANRRFDYSADQTLKIMQSLYETHKVLTYPRTSSRYLTTDIAATLPKLLQTVSDVAPFQQVVKDIVQTKAGIAKRMVDNEKVTDHHAIIPTDKRPNVSRLSAQEQNVYLLVLRRFLAAFLPVCKKDHTELICKIGDETFKATGTIIREMGWRRLYQEDETEKKTAKKSKAQKEETLLPNVVKGDQVAVQKINLKEGKTKAPPMYNEATILAAMETAGKQIDDEDLRQAMKDCGLGTPATRAQILEKLIQVKYLVRDKKKLLPTSKAEYLIDNIHNEALLSPELTGQWEKKLNDMAKSNFSRERYMEEIKEMTKEITESVESSENMALRADQKILGTCPSCEEGKIVETQKAFGCTMWKSKGCTFVVWKQMAGKPITEKHVKTLLKKGLTSVIKGFKSKAGNTFDAALKLEGGKVGFDFQRETLGVCPKCGGNIVETPKAFSCDTWRTTGCKFAIWKSTSGRDIKKTEAATLLKQGKTKVLEGFKNREQEPFSASLILREGRVEFDRQGK